MSISLRADKDTQKQLKDTITEHVAHGVVLMPLVDLAINKFAAAATTDLPFTNLNLMPQDSNEDRLV